MKRCIYITKIQVITIINNKIIKLHNCRTSETMQTIIMPTKLKRTIPSPIRTINTYDMTLIKYYFHRRITRDTQAFWPRSPTEFKLYTYKLILHMPSLETGYWKFLREIFLDGKCNVVQIAHLASSQQRFRSF